MEQISGSEANSSLATQEIRRILRKPEVLVLILQVPTMRGEEGQIKNRNIFKRSLDCEKRDKN
jgi:hypothetical protein